MFVDNSLLGGITRDLATVSGTAAGTPFTLYETTLTDATGLTPSTTPWGLAASGDGAAYQSAANWPTSFSASRYLKLSFPAYVPSGATGQQRHLQALLRSATLGTTCFYFEVYSGDQSDRHPRQLREPGLLQRLDIDLRHRHRLAARGDTAAKANDLSIKALPAELDRR